jgi:hypothetical protein
MSLDNIKVTIKVRPLIDREKLSNAAIEWVLDQDNCLNSVNNSQKFQFGKLNGTVCRDFVQKLKKHKEQ